MSFRLLSSLLLALAMLIAPVAIVNGSAMAMAPAAEHHEMMMMEAGHCEGQPAPAPDSQSEKSCCAAMCTAIAVAPVSPAEPLALAASIDRAPLATSGPSFLVELPTPPPRFG